MGEMSSFLKEFVEFNVKAIVDNPDKVNINISVSTKSIILHIDSEESDRGKIIGKSGKNINALTMLCHAAKMTKYPTDSRKIIPAVTENENSQFSSKKKEDKIKC